MYILILKRSSSDVVVKLYRLVEQEVRGLIPGLAATISPASKSQWGLNIAKSTYM